MTERPAVPLERGVVGRRRNSLRLLPKHLAKALDNGIGCLAP